MRPRDFPRDLSRRCFFKWLSNVSPSRFSFVVEFEEFILEIHEQMYWYKLNEFICVFLVRMGPRDVKVGPLQSIKRPLWTLQQKYALRNNEVVLRYSRK